MPDTRFRILFRVDASVSIGSGHIMRCLALAEALAPYAQCDFICATPDGNLISLVQQQGFWVYPITPCLPDEQADAENSLSAITDTYDLLIVDHYQLAAAYCQKMRETCRFVMVIDDLANRKHDCDLLLDQNLLPDADSRYQGLLPTHCKQLTGPQYALLRAEFYQACNTQQRDRLLIFFGGADADNLTTQAILALKQLKQTAPAADIVIGASNPWREQIIALSASLPNAKLHIQCNYMASLMHRARLMLGAGGTSHWERCITALPGLVVTVADNQQQVTAYLATSGVCVWLGQAAEMSADYFAEQLSFYLAQPVLLSEMSRRAAVVIPENSGTPLVVAAILQQLRS